MNQSVKIYQIATNAGVEPEVVVQRANSLGIAVRNVMSKVTVEDAERLKNALQREKQDEWVEVQLADGVIKRVKRPRAAAPEPSVPATPAISATEPAVVRTPVREPVAVPVVESKPAPTVEPPPAVVVAVREASEIAPASTASAVSDTATTATEFPTKPAAKSHTSESSATPLVKKGSSIETRPVTKSRPKTTKKSGPVEEREPASEPIAAVTAPSVVVAEPTATSAAPAHASDSTAVAPAPSTVVSAATAEEPMAKPAVVAVEVSPSPSSAETAVASALVPEPSVSPAIAPSAVTEPVSTDTVLPAASREDAQRGAPTTTAQGASASHAEPARASSEQEMTKTSTTMHVTPTVPQTGFSYWDPTTKQVVKLDRAPSSTPQRRQEVSPDRIRGAGRPPPGTRGPAGRGPNPVRGTIGRGVVRGGVRSAAPTTQPSAAHKRVVKIEGQITIQRLASEMSRKATEVLVKLISMGKQGLNLNTTLDVEEATLIAQEFGHEVENVAVSMDDAIKALLPTYRDDPADDEERAPVVTVMGHVDHGKTTLLDSILGMRVAEGEAGGITQKVSAYRVQTKKGPVVFFDTPGHEAFTKLRARGAKTTDVAVLVVAADDGVMPTTVEAINHARVADVPIVVALNKIDKPNANPDRVISQLLTYEVIAEQHGGDVLVVPVSAKLKTGIEELLENLALQSEILELKANPKRPGQGTVFDATLDKGRGVVARMLVQDGTVRAGDLILSGTSFGKIRAMFDDRGKPIAKAGPSTPIEVLGLNEVPAAGDRFYVVADVKKVLAFVDEQKAKMAKGPIAGPGPTLAERISMHLSGDVTITMGVIIKAEAQASIEALSKALVELSTDKVKVQVIHSGIGGITESDVQLAAASSIPTTVIGFNVRPQGKAQQLADSSKVSMRLYTIIYDAIDELKALMIGQLKPTLVEKQLGQAEVRQVFSITKVGVIAGCMVTSGKILRTASARLVRDSVEVWKGKLGSLRRFKEDAKEVAQGYECGIGLEGYGDLKPGDIIEAYEHEEVAAQL